MVLNPIRMGGHMLARASVDRHAVDALADLASAEGGLLLTERPARPAEVGKRLNEVADGLGLKLVRDGTAIGFWDRPVIAAGDTIVGVVQAG